MQHADGAAVIYPLYCLINNNKKIIWRLCRD